MKKRTIALGLVLLAAATAATTASARPTGSSPHAAATAVATCTSSSIGFMGPITGPVAFLGKEQLNWAKFSLERFNKANGTSFKLAEGDTQLNAAQAQKVATKFTANKSILATVGPAGSQENYAVAPIFAKAKLAHVSSSATNTGLTKGKKKAPLFSRVVGSDDTQGRTDALFMINKLKAKKVFIVDDQESYSTGLAYRAGQVLRSKGVKVQRESVNQKVTDFSSLVSKIGDDVDVVFLPWQVAANGQLFGQQMREQGKRAKLFGSDGLDSGDFTINGAYVSAFARDIRGLASAAKTIKEYNAKYGTKWGTFGPPTYVAVVVVATAARTACADGSATRAEVAAAIRKVKLSTTILGIPLSFDANGDVPTAKFYIFQIQGKAKKLVG